MKIKAVIFDLDGTITEPYLDFDAIRKEMGVGEAAGSILELMEEMTPQQREDVERILYVHEQRAVDESTLNPGAQKTLEALGRAGIHVGILTRNRKCNALAIAQKHGLKFDAVIGREDGPVHVVENPVTESSRGHDSQFSQPFPDCSDILHVVQIINDVRRIIAEHIGRQDIFLILNDCQTYHIFNDSVHDLPAGTQ